MAFSSSGTDRQAFLRQPARAVLVDFHPPMDTTTCLNIQEALSSTLTLLHHVAGPCRLPFFSLIVLGSYPECIFPLQQVKGNHPRVHGALNELKSLARSMVVQSHFKGCLLEGLQEALAQFHRMAQNYRQGGSGGSFPSQIELTLVTAQPPATIRRYVERIADHLDLEHLKKISGVCVSDPDRILHAEPDEDEMLSQSFSEFTSSPSELGLSILDLTSIDNDVLSLQNVFKSWLHDCGTDSEHLHLMLPPTHTYSGEQMITLKCDMQERVLDPSSIPVLGQHFKLQTTGQGGSSQSGGRGSSSASSTSQPLPVYQLRAVGLVTAEGVCESVLYGTPHILKPTTCWKLDWEELERNHHHFNALCQLLQNRGQMLIASADVHSSTSTHPHFLLLPSSSFTLLIKPVAVSELLLPVELPPTEEKPTQEAQQTITHCLEQLEQHDCYNPLLVHSGLHQGLTVLSNSTRRGQLSKTTINTRGTFQPPVQRHTSSSNRGRGGRSLGPKRSYGKGGLAIKGN